MTDFMTEFRRRQAADGPGNYFALTNGQPRPWSAEYLAMHRRRVYLPAYGQLDRVYHALQETQVVIIDSPTGSGKSTQVPQLVAHMLLYNGDNRKIYVTQPRRVPTTSVAARLEVELDHPGIVGVQMRGLNTTDRGTATGGTRSTAEGTTATGTTSAGGATSTEGTTSTSATTGNSTGQRIIVLTDGMLLQYLSSDPLLTESAVVIIDEAHERGINIDLILALLIPTLRQRPDLKLILMSATGDNDAFLRSFRPFNPTLVELPGQEKRVTDVYLGDIVDWAGAAARSVFTIRKDGRWRGHILVFCPGRRSMTQLDDYLGSFDTIPPPKVLQLYRDLPAKEQAKVLRTLESTSESMVVLATNIAETSLTIPNLDVVIDSGQRNVNMYHARSGGSELLCMAATQAAIIQRRGRVGRVTPGLFVATYAKDYYDALPFHPSPPIIHSDLTDLIARVLAMGKRIDELEWITRPTREAILRALFTLQHLGFLKVPGVGDAAPLGLTQMGLDALNYGLSPSVAHIVIHALGTGYEYELLALAALLEQGGIRKRDPRNPASIEVHRLYIDYDSDTMTDLNLWLEFKECNATQHDGAHARATFLDFRACRTVLKRVGELQQLWRKMGRPPTRSTAPREGLRKAVARALYHAFRYNLAEHDGEYWRNVFKPAPDWIQSRLSLWYMSDLKGHHRPPRLVVYTELEHDSADRKFIMKGVTNIPVSWFQEWQGETAGTSSVTASETSGTSAVAGTSETATSAA